MTPKHHRSLSSSASSLSRSLRHHALWMALTMAIGLPTAQAQQVNPDGGTHTSVLNAANGVPVVNIAAPNGAGVSHNTYQQFNVGSNGLIFNNSGAISKTQLAGYVNGNTNFGTGQSATLILNEVTSTLPSQLNGAMEVAGNQAQVVVANPNGISCEGCGFINVSRGVLTTGTPVFGSDGSLSALRVTGGTITIDGSGMNGMQADRVDLLARAVVINAGVWANQLNIVTGANQIDYATLATQPITGTGPTPSFALDVSALGGMYAGVIRLVGTEAGLGVNSQGQIAAQSGDLSITNAGQVVLAGKNTATGNITIDAAQALSNQGTLAAGGAVNLASSDFNNSGVLYSGGAMNVSATGQLSNGGQIEAQNGTLSLQANGALTNSVAGSVLADTGNISLNAATIGNAGTLSAGANATLNASSSLNTSGTLVANGAVMLTAPSLTTAGAVQAGSTLGISGASLTNSGKLYALGGNWSATLSGAFANQGTGDVYGSAGITIAATSLDNAGGVEAQQAANVNLGGALINSGKLQSDQSSITLHAQSLSNTGTFSAAQNLQWQVANVTQNSGVLVSGQSIGLSSGSFDNQSGGQIQSGSDLNIIAATLSNEGDINAKGNATLAGSALSNAGSAQLIAAGSLTLSQTGSVSNAGVLQSGSDFNLTQAASLSNVANATIYAGQDFNLTLSQALTNAGMLYATRTVTLAAGSVGNTGTLRSGGALSLSSAGDIVSSGAIQAQQSLSLQSAADFSNSGQLYAIDDGLNAQIGGAFSSTSASDIYSGQNIGFNAASFANAGTLEAKQGVNVVVQGNAGNTGSMQADNGNLVMSASALNNQGSFSAIGKTQLTASGNLSNSGQVVTGQQLSLSGANVSNSGQMQSGGNTSLQAAAIDNSGRLQSGGTLAISGNTTLTNEASGSLLAAGDLSADTATLLSNAGVIQAGGNLSIDGAGAVNNASGSTLYGALLTSLQLGGGFTNAGTVYGAQGVNLTAASVNNSGSLRSGAAIGLTTQGNASNSGTAYAAGDANWNVAGTLSNSGTLAATDNTTLTVGSLTGNGTLAAGLQSDGSLGSTGVLDVTATGSLASWGSALAAGNLLFSGSSIDLSNSQTRAGGNIILTAAQGNVINAGGNLAANGVVSISAAGALINGGSTVAQGGKISGATLILQAASLDNEYGSLTQTGNSDLTLSFTGAFENAYGKFASNAADLSIQAASLDNTGGTIQQAGSGALTLDASGNLTNANGQIAGNGSLNIQSGSTLNNAGGALSVSGNTTLKAVNFNDSQGKLIAGNIGLTVTQALTNTSGTLQAAGALTLNTGSLDNTAGFIKVTDAQALGVTASGALTNGAGGFIGGNGAVSVNADSLTNAGQIYAGSTLNATTQSNFNNNSGALQAMSSLTVSSGAALSNRSGQIEAGAGNTAATLNLGAASLDNTGGRIADSGSGSTTVNAAQSIGNEGGTLGGQGAVTLSTGSLDNSNSGHVVAGQNLGFNLGGMNNAGGTVYAAGNLNWSNGGASLANAGGNLGAGGGLSLLLLSLDDSNGAVAANGNVTLNAGSFSGVGRIAAGQDLTLTSSGSYTNAVGNQLVANGNMTLNLGGNFSNTSGATLQAVGNLTVNAGNIDNAASATINSTTTTLSTGGALTNEGSIQGNSIALSAGSLTNTSNIIGGSITANAWNLTNGVDLGTVTDNNPYQTALIAGSNSVTLYVGGTLLNRDASIFTTGNLNIASDANGDQTIAVNNLSGDMEADGNITIDANQFTNQRRVFQTITYNLSTDEQAQNTNTGAPDAVYRYDDTNPQHQPPYVSASQVLTQSQVASLEAFCGQQSSPGTDGGQWCNGVTMPGQSDTHDILHNDLRSITTATLTAVQELAAASAESRLLASGNITLNGSVLNDKSTISAGNNLVINGQNGSGGGGNTSNATVQNIAFTPTGTLQESINEQTGIEYVSNSGGRHWAFQGYQTWGNYQDSVQVALGSGQASWITFNAGPGLAATMSAGNTVSITAQTISNTTVGADGQPVHAVIGLGQNNGSQAVGGSGAAAVGSASGTGGSTSSVALGNAPGTTSGGSLSTATARSVSIGSTSSSSGGNSSLATPQVVSTLVGPNASVNLPQSGLYTINTSPSSNYLVETDPRFANYSNFISSNYLLQQLGYNPSNVEERLGDGFYEEQQVLNQITSLTGRRFLNNDTDALDQYRDLMNNAVSASQQFNLSVGVALTPAQMASLTQDIVWLVNVTVDGKQVLEPVVYLSASDAKNLAANGATIAGKNVVLNATGDITNNGTIAASNDAQITAANLLNGGSISAGNNLSINAAQNILNGGSISAGGNVALVAGNDVLSGVSVAQSLGAVQINGLSSQISPVALSNTSLLGSISAGGNLAISAGRDLSLDTAPVMATGNLSLAAGRDLTATATAISAGGNAQLLAGRDLGLLATGSTTRTGAQMNGTESTTYTVSTVTAGGALSLVAGNNLSSQGTQFTGSAVNLAAGNDANLSAVTDVTTSTTQTFQNHTQVTTGQSDQTVRGTAITGANGITVTANHDLTITAGTLNSSNGDVTLGAGNNLTLAAAQEDHSSYRDTSTHKSGLLSSSTTKTHDATSDSDVVGTSIAGNNVTLAAGNNLTTVAAQVAANNALALSAGNDINLAAGQQTHDEEHDYSQQTSSFFSTAPLRFGSVDPTWTSHNSSNTISQTNSIGSTLSGDTVTVAAGHDLTGTAVQIAGTHDVTLAAGNNLTLTAGQDTYNQTDATGSSHTGLMNGGGFSVLIGNKTVKTTDTINDVSYTGSLVGSTSGSVLLSAGNNVHITGSDVLSQTATTIIGKNVTIDAALGSEDVTQTQKQSSAGISVGLSGGVASIAQTLATDVQGATQSSNDPRLKALYAMQAAQTLFSPGAGNAMHLPNGEDGASALVNAAKGSSSTGISLHVGIGGGSSTSTGKTHDDVAYGSQITSQGNVTIAATDGDLNVIGSQITGNNVALSASNNINLLSQAEQHTDSNTSHNASGEIGLSIGQTTGIYLTASAGEALAHGNGTTHDDSVVSAANNLTLISGNDTTIKGAQATGNSVLADIGGNLNIASEQDTNDYASHSIQGGITLVYGWSNGGVGVSGNLALSKANSNYASVTQMSGIGAGSGGYDLLVGGNTNLTGAVIASSADASKNILDTGSLTYSNIQNESKSSAESISIGGGYGTGGMSGMTGLTGGIGIPQNSNQSSSTQAGIALGTIVVRKDPGQDLGGLNRNPSLSDANGLTNSFDPQKIAENQQIGMLAGQVGMTAAGDIERAEGLQNGSSGAVALHAAVGAATAALGGGNALQGMLGAGAAEAATPLTESWAFNNDGTLSASGRAGQEVVSTLIGGLVGGGSGAAGALYGEEYNRQLHINEQEAILALSQKGYSEDQLQAVACVMVHCLSGRGLTEGTAISDGATPVLTPAGQQLMGQYSQVLSQMTPAQQSQMQTVLQNTGLFTYSFGDAWFDAWSDIHGTTRIQGLNQAMGAFLQGYIYARVAGSSPAANGVAVVGTGEVADQMAAGITTWWTGNANPTLQNQLWQQLGLSPSQANLAEMATDSMTGIVAGRLGMGPSASSPTSGSATPPNEELNGNTSSGGNGSQSGAPGNQISGQTTTVGTGEMAANDGSYTVPPGYTQNLDGSVTGPRGGTYVPTGTLDANGNQVFQNANGGGYYTLTGEGASSSLAPSTIAGQTSGSILAASNQAHMQAVDGATNSFLAQGVSGVQTEVTFNSIQNGDVIASRADMVVNATPNSNLQVPAGYVAVDINGNPLSSIPVSANGQVVIEMKTGAGGFTSNQATVYPAIQAGNASGVGSNAASASIQGSVPSTPVVVLRKL